MEIYLVFSRDWRDIPIQRLGHVFCAIADVAPGATLEQVEERGNRMIVQLPHHINLCNIEQLRRSLNTFDVALYRAGETTRNKTTE